MNQTTLRDYQSRAVADVLARFNEGSRSVVLVSPTGSGKTVMGAALVQELVRSGHRLLWLAHRIELVEQAIAKMGVPCGVIVAGARFDGSLFPVIVGSVQTVARRELPDVDVVVIDEAHHAMSPTYRRVLESYAAVKVLGLTATPCRLDGKGLGDIFEAMVEASTTSKLVEMGALVKPRVFTHPTQPDVSSVKKTAGDFNEKELEQACNQAKIRGDIVKHWLEKAAGRPSVLFAVSLEHSRALLADFAAAGVPCVHVDGKMGRREREGALDAIRTGKAQILSNVGIVTEGWDFPALEVCVLARPTQSLSLYMQMVGRVMRPHPGKAEALVLDHAGNVIRQGILPWQDVNWAERLASKKKRKGKAGGPVLKSCPECYCTMVATASTCADCGYVFVVKRDEPEQDTQTQLVEITDEVMAMIAKKRSEPVFKPGVMMRLEQEGVRFRVERGGLAWDDPNGFVQGFWLGAIEKEKKKIVAATKKEKPSAYMTRLLARIESRQVHPAFLELVKKNRGSVGRAVFEWKSTRGGFP